MRARRLICRSVRQTIPAANDDLASTMFLQCNVRFSKLKSGVSSRFIISGERLSITCHQRCLSKSKASKAFIIGAPQHISMARRSHTVSQSPRVSGSCNRASEQVITPAASRVVENFLFKVDLSSQRGQRSYCVMRQTKKAMKGRASTVVGGKWVIT